MLAPKLPPDAIDRELAATPGWTHADDKLTRTFEFPDFVAAFGWMTRCALVAERMGHHPEWCNVYGRVTVELTTHDAGGITALDFELARAMSALA